MTRIRVVPSNEIPLDKPLVQKGIISFTVQSALDERRATGLTVLEDRESGQALVFANTPHGTLEQMGSSVYDALGRFITLAIRREGRS